MDVTQKPCTSCGVDKALSEFHRLTASPDGRRPNCKACVAAVSRGYLLKKRWGISIEVYDQMLIDQGGGCALCGATTPGGRWPSFHVDHCHETGRVRGLLCYPCNFSLGVLGDTTEGLMRAHRYIQGEMSSPPTPVSRVRRNAVTP